MPKQLKLTDMKKFTTLLLLSLMCIASMNAEVVIGSKTYSVDTILQRQIGPGVVHTIVRIPDYPLNVYLLEVDMTNPYNRVETTQAKNRLGSTEKLEDAYIRHKSMGKKPLAACNASFWCVPSQLPWYNFMPGVPHGAEVVNDTIYVNTNRNGVFDFNGGSVNTASTIIDKAGKVHVGRHEWYGCVKSSKFSADQEIIQVNKCCDTGQLVLFNHARGRNSTFYTYPSDCDYIFLNLKDGESWKIAKDIKFEVAEIKTSENNQVLGNYDACLIADGDYKTEMAKLAVGDEVAINTYWFDIDGDKTPIEVENMTEGEAHVMLKGEITNRATGDYGAMVYSRTAYGSNADGTKLYMIVIDKSTHSEYGVSAGCTATVMCQLWKSLVPDLYNVANMDAGGSAQMMVGGKVINKTTESTPRAVANGMMLFSVAPEEDSDVITELRFVDNQHRLAALSLYAPKVIGYNKYGELVSDDVPVTYTCSENVGAPNADGSAIIAGRATDKGTITAHYNNVEVTADMYVVAEKYGIRLKSIVIDNIREYKMEVTTSLDGVVQSCDPSLFTWSVADETIATIDNCVLKGLKEGTTTITATLGDYTDEAVVKVEIADKWKDYQTWDGWTVSGLKLTTDTKPTLSSEGVVAFNYSGSVNASVSLDKDVTLYSLPDHLWIEFTSTTKLMKVEFDIRSNLTKDDEEQHIVKFPESGMLNKDEKISIDVLSSLGDLTDIGVYPIIIKSITFTPYWKGYTAGENTITIHGLWAEYDVNKSGVEDVWTTKDSKISIFPNPVVDGRFAINSTDMDKLNVGIYNMSGALLWSKAITVKDGKAIVEPGLAAGIYLVKVEGGTESVVCKVIMK